MSFPLGEVAGALAISEQLGGLLNVAMWLKGSAASVASNLAGPSYSAVTRLDNLRTPVRETTGQAAPRPTQAQVEEARRHFAYVMLASFAALLLGGFAAYGAGMATTPRVVKQVTETVT